MGSDEYNPFEMEKAAPAAEATETPAPAGTAQSTAPSTPDAVEAPADQPSGTPSRGVYRRRQAKLLLGVAAVVAAGLYLSHTGIPGAAPSPQAQAEAAESAKANASSVPGLAQARTDQAAAGRFYARHGTYRGFTAPGARTAATDTIWMASRLTKGVCVMYAMRGTDRSDVAVDPSKVACTDAEMAATARQLDADADVTDRAGEADAAAALDHMARTAAGYATTAFRAGVPSLHGLPVTGLVDGVRVVANHGTHIVVRYQAGSTCVQATIGRDGTLSETTGC